MGTGPEAQAGPVSKWKCVLHYHPDVAAQERMLRLQMNKKNPRETSPWTGKSTSRVYMTLYVGL